MIVGKRYTSLKAIATLTIKFSILQWPKGYSPPNSVQLLASTTLSAILGNSNAHHSCVEKQGKLSGTRLSDHFLSIQFTDALMSDGYFHIFLTDESN